MKAYSTKYLRQWPITVVYICMGLNKNNKMGSWFLICLWCYCKMTITNNDNIFFFFFITVIWEDLHHHIVAGKEIWMCLTTLVLVSHQIILQGQFCFIRNLFEIREIQVENLMKSRIVGAICIIPLILTIFWDKMLSLQSCSRFSSHWVDMTELL